MSHDDLTTPADLRALYGDPSPLARRKQLDRLDRHARDFIALAPLVIVASSDAQGRGDCTPRGDAPGFVTVLDDATLIIPDRRGNNRVDTMLNITENPHVGLLFLVPGINETLRVNGRATIRSDPALLEPLTVQEQRPKAGIVVAVEEVFFHCGKALIRSDLWNPERRVERSRFPTLGRILADQIADADAAASERAIEEAYRTKLY